MIPEPEVTKSFANTALSFFKWETLVIDRLLLQLIFVACVWKVVWLEMF